MTKQVTTAIRLNGWCKHPYRTPEQAILSLDLAIQDAPQDASNILGTAWTAIVMLTDGRGIPAAQWLSPMAHFHKLSAAALVRVRDAVEMRLRAVERIAA